MTRRSQQARRDGYRATRREYFFGGASAISFFGVGQVEQIFFGTADSIPLGSAPTGSKSGLRVASFGSATANLSRVNAS